MAISEDGSTRQAKAIGTLQNGVLASLNRSFQTRLYRVDAVPARIDNLTQLQTNAPSTRIGDSLKQLSEETSDLPIGAVLLLSDGDDNTGGVSADAINALRARPTAYPSSASPTAKSTTTRLASSHAPIATAPIVAIVINRLMSGRRVASAPTTPRRAIEAPPMTIAHVYSA